MDIKRYLPKYTAKDIPPTVALYRLRDGETIWNVAYNMTGDARNWVKICLYNGITNPLDLPGELRYPVD